MIQLLEFKERLILLAIFAFMLLFLAATFFIPVFLLVFVSAALWLFVMIVYFLLLVDKRVEGHAKRSKYSPPVSIIVPVYNSIGTLKKFFEYVKKINYSGKIEIICVEDGSTDGSREFLEKVKGIRLIKCKKNSGCKATPLNKGIALAKYEYVVCLDSDTYPEPEILNKMMGYFDDDPKVGAVGSMILPDKNKSIVQKIQYIEYAMGLGLWASALSALNSRTTIPGAMVVMRKKVIKEIGGGFDPDNLTEDMEIVMRLQKHGYKVKTCFEALALTDVPNTLKKMFIQRERWFRGRIFNLIKYKELFFSRKNFDLGFFGLPYLFFLEILSVVLILRVVIMFFADALNFLQVESTVAGLSGSFGYFTFQNPVISPFMVIAVASYAFMFVYYFLALHAIHFKPQALDYLVILINVLLYPYFICFVYFESFLKEMIGTGSKWVRVST
ncbi:Dolichyl N-acetyl-alpha-D-glucosaminyl phosphate 3-beta-D-2,3-diacetamido-2,3-dideoxy-beta-D-glucuronosyltransferase [uncultured archaeon]|nr:Dolichyl N-acetyl-alpha-D-glucosaminyl phosphate 3-beta-D-2,3-diacetamido-2,3-dideoxy-beta-D-glucuronosyltransferase [uncultured archaeon]